MMAEKERYSALDGIRAVAAICIVLMHVKANGDYNVPGFFYGTIITSFTNFTYLFMLLSAFSMCCGYYESFREGSINLGTFYKRRYQRIWPYFAILCTLELVVEHNLHSLYEWFADLTLVFGLLPNANISVIGVGWFLGTIFTFYFVFPFFTVLIANKKRAWISLIVAVIFNILCNLYFFDNKHVVESFSARTNIIFCSMFFIMGGLIYLYRKELKKFFSKRICIPLLILILGIVLYYTIVNSIFINLVLFALITIIGICVNNGPIRFLLDNKILSFLGSISMEIYLSHMLVFRIIEKVNLIHITGNDTVNYIIISISTILGAIVVSLILRSIIILVIEKCNKKVIGKEKIDK